MRFEFSLGNGTKTPGRSGCHFRIFPKVRAHIFLNGDLVAGDVNKPLYKPGLISFLIVYFFFIFGFGGTIALSEFYFDKYKEEKERIERVKSNSADLYQSTVQMVFNDKGNKGHELVRQKKDEWAKLCIERSDHHCRLANYAQIIVDTNFSKALNFVLRACKNSHLLSCYSAFLNRFLTLEHDDFKYVSTTLKDYCLKGHYEDDRRKNLCLHTSYGLMRYYNDEEAYKGILGNLCKTDYLDSCELLKGMEISGEI